MENTLIGEINSIMPLAAKSQSTKYVFLAYITKVINISDVINTIPIGVRQ